MLVPPVEMIAVVKTGDAADCGLAEWSGGDEGITEVAWDRFSDTARALFSVLIDEPGREFSGDELAQRLDVREGRRGRPSLLLVLGYVDGKGTVVHWMTDEMAALFRKFRDRYS
ncbi:DUF6416 domain-containing protein [Spirillospora sp. NPDC050679]